MANPEDTFDPNDLESIDALLDEAELEAVSDDFDTAEPNLDAEPAVEEAPAPSNDVASEAVDNSPDADDDILDGLDGLDGLELDAMDDDFSESESKPEAVSEAESPAAPEPVPVADDIEPQVVAVSEPLGENKTNQIKANASAADESDKQDEKDADDFLQKRMAAKASNNSNLSVKEMDSIKKLIIIFGSVLTVLVIVAISMALWSALAASSAGVDDETKSLIESIKVSSEQNGSAIQESDKITKSVEKKLDAINYQLEQLAVDLAALPKAKEEVLDPLGLNTKATEASQKSEVTPVPHATVGMDEETKKRIASVSSRLLSAQRKLDEINKRIKLVQDQAGALMNSMKVVEKQALLDQAEHEEKLAAEAEKAKKSQGNPYQYSAPDGVFYDQSVSDSYP